MFLFPENLLQMNKWIKPDPDLLTVIPFKNKDRTASGLSIYFKLSPRRCYFSSWFLSNQSLVNWSAQTSTAVGKTGLVIALKQVSLISLLAWYFMTENILVQSWLIWTTFPIASNRFCFIRSSLCEAITWIKLIWMIRM